MAAGRHRLGPEHFIYFEKTLEIFLKDSINPMINFSGTFFYDNISAWHPSNVFARMISLVSYIQNRHQYLGLPGLNEATWLAALSSYESILFKMLDNFSSDDQKTALHFMTDLLLGNIYRVFPQAAYPLAVEARREAEVAGVSPIKQVEAYLYSAAATHRLSMRTIPSHLPITATVSPVPASAAAAYFPSSAPMPFVPPTAAATATTTVVASATAATTATPSAAKKEQVYPTVKITGPALTPHQINNELNLSEFSKSRTLERKENSKFPQVLGSFLGSGGTIVPGIALSYDKVNKKWKAGVYVESKTSYMLEERSLDELIIDIPTGSHVFPVCQAGENRSQVAYRLLTKSLTRVSKESAREEVTGTLPNGRTVTVYPPHGTEGTMDPFIIATMTTDEISRVDNPDWDFETAYQYHAVEENSDFKAEFKEGRRSRFGETACLEYLGHNFPSQNIAQLLQTRNPDVLKEARKFMDQYFFEYIIQLAASEKPVHLIVFNRALHVMAMRLLEVANGRSLRHIVFHPVDSQDPIVVKALPSFGETFRQILRLPPKPSPAATAALSTHPATIFAVGAAAGAASTATGTVCPTSATAVTPTPTHSSH